MNQLTNAEIVSHLLGPRVIVEDGVYFQTDPDNYFAGSYASIMANVQGSQQEAAVVTSVQTIEHLVQVGLKHTDGILAKAQAGVVLDATYPLIALIGEVNGVDELCKTYMGFLVLNPKVPTEEDLDGISEDLFMP